MKRPIRVGMIGTGNICCHAHIPAYTKVDDIVVNGFYDIDYNASQNARELYLRMMKEANKELDASSVIVYDSAEDMLKNVDAVDICTTLKWHAYYADLALRNGVSAMSEKPAARTWAEIAQVAKTAASSSAIYQLNDDNVFIPRYQAMRNVVESGLVGEVQSIWISRGSYSVSPDRSEWFYDPVQSGGGCIMDYGSHAVCSTWYILGYDKIPEEVKSLKIGVNDRTRYQNGRFTSIEVDDNALFKVRYRDPSNGGWIDAVIEATWTWPRLATESSDVRGYIEVLGSNGTASCYFDEENCEFIKIKNHVFGEKLIPVKSVESEESSFVAEIRNFVNSVRNRKKSILDANIAENIIKILNCAQLSELNNRISVTINQIEYFSRDFIKECVWNDSDSIALALNSPYKLHC